jgi:membrane associated rhomboid family serine protease
VFPIKAKYFVMIYGAIELYSAMNVNSGVSNIAHLGGMAFGFIYLKMRFPTLDLEEVRGWYARWKMQRAKRKFQVYLRKQGSDRDRWVN